MRDTATYADAIQAQVAALQRGECDEATARRLYALGPDSVTLALPAAARRIAEQDAHITQQDARIGELRRQAVAGQTTPATPSGMISVYAKPTVPSARGRGRKAASRTTATSAR